MRNSGFIMLNRDIMDWEWYTDVNTCKVFLHCLLKVNYSKKKWQGNVINKGEFITSFEKIAVETGLSISKVRTALSKLQSTKNIYLETSNSFTKVGMFNIEDFILDSLTDSKNANSKPDSKPVNKQLSNDSQAVDNQIATTNTNNKILTRIKKFREEVFSHTQHNIKILESFFNYWSELNLEKTKMRKEDESYFEISKRLKKWSESELKFKNVALPESNIISNRE